MTFNGYPFRRLILLAVSCLAFLFTSLYSQTFTDESSQITPSNNSFEWGTSAADFNNDGLVDIYHPGRLYINQGGSFVDIMSSTGINEGSSIFGAVFGDYDGDGYLDVLFEDFSFSSNSRLFRNNGDRTFERVDQQVGLDVIGLTQGAGWADFNRDGQLDLFVNEDTGVNQMFLNNNGMFTDISATSNAPTNGNSYGMSWGDYNNDGYPDVFIATCNGNPNNSIKHLLRNNGDNTFTDVNYQAGVADSLASWGISWVDYDNDGWLDIFIANTNHGGIQVGRNVLYKNNRDGTFSDVSAAAGIEGNFSNSSFATAAADFDNDGWCDLYVGNSNTTHILYKNNGNGTFTNISGTAGIIESNHQAVAVADFNNDGWMDIFSAGGPQNRLMINDGGTNHWLKITTRGTQSSYNAVGARLTMYINGDLQIREIRAGDSFCSQNDLMTAHFGLGTATEADSLIIEWPVGTVDKLYNVAADRHIEVREGIGEVSPLQQVSLGFPADGDTLRAISAATLRWDLVGGNGLLGTEMGTSFNLRLKGTNLDTVFSNISDTSYALDLSLLNSGSTYEWMIEATDGFSVLASRELNSFRYERAAFTSVTPGDIGSDQLFSEGGSWADYDGDGDLDLFVTNIINQNNILYRNEGNGSFTSVTGISPVTDGGFSYGSHWVDYDNDGDVDLFVVNGGGSQNEVNFLYRNDNASFTRITDGPVATDANGSWSAAWADYDLDGDLDLFVANYNQPNALYENDGSGAFVRLSGSGVEGNNTPSLGSSWADYNGDGYPDLFVANANFGSGAVNNLYTNNGEGTFSEVTTGSVASDLNNSVAASWGDPDNDGDLDLLVTNYFNENNALYMNNGDGTFTPASGIAPVQDGGLSVGSAWGDFDNDGDLDLAISDDEANGLNRLYLGDGLGGFTAVTGEPVVTDVARTNSMTWADYDGDGDLDLFTANGDQAPNELSNFLYKNNQNNGNNWIKLRLNGLLSNAQAVGAKVHVRARIDGENRWQMQEISTQTGYNSQNSLDVEFGLAGATRVDSIRIEWPSGIVQRIASVDVNQLLEIEEDLTLSVDPVADAIVPEQINLAQNYPNPFNPETVIRFSLPQAELVTLEVYNLLGQRVSLLVDQQITAGVHEVKWRAQDDNGKPVQSGIYFYRLRAGEQVITKKMTLIK